jgi:predicted dinucleotide-binding enzyme
VTPKQIGIIGKGNVGSALARGLARAGHMVKVTGSNPEGVRRTILWSDIAILAVPFGAIDAVLKEAGAAVDGKTLVDATNALGPEMQWAVGFMTSGAEELQKKAPKAHIVKAFNTVFAEHMDSGRLGDQQLTALVAGDDEEAKNSVLAIARDIGFDAVDAGPLSNARLLEPLGYLNIQLGYTLGMGQQIGFKLHHIVAARQTESGNLPERQTQPQR